MTDKEIVKSKIRELASKIKNEEEEWIWEGYEKDIVKLIIDYSIRQNIKIPLLNYDLYNKDEKENASDESYDYFTDFTEVIGEESLSNPRFKIHPDIKELVDLLEYRINPKNMNIVKVASGKVELRKDTGSLVRTIVSSGAIDADINGKGSLILVTTANGKVELRKDSGSLIRTIVSSDAVGAKFSGSDIQVKKANGKTELRNESGSLIRTL